MKYKILILPLLITLLSAGCSLFSGGPVAAGVAKTVNGGSDWQFSNVFKNSKTESLSQSNISKLALDPQNREVVYAGCFTGGLYKSEDSGATWVNILSKILVYDLVINPGDSKIIFASGSFGDQGMVLKTTDGGGSWQQVYNESSASNPTRAVALNLAAPNQLVIGTASGNLIKSLDNGLSWQLANNFDDQINRVFWRQDGLYVLLKTKGLYKGSIAGGDFVKLTGNMIKSAPNDYLYDNNLIFNQAYVDPFTSNLIYVTTSRGLFKSVDNGSNWSQMALPVPKDKAIARAITVAPSSSNIVFTSVGQVVYKSTDGGSTWQTQNILTSGYVNYILVDPQLPQIVYAGLYVPSQ